MTKADALRKRYILFELRGAEFDAPTLKRGLYNEALKFFGEYGLSFVALKLEDFYPSTKKGFLRCERGELDKVLGFLALIHSLDGKPARIVTLKSSGTIKGLGQPEFSRTQRK